MLKSLLKTTTNQPQTDLGLLILRLGLAFFMARHGYDKLQSLLNNPTDFPDPLHIGWHLSLVLTVFAEFVCSILLAVGLFTRLALIPLIICMLVVIFLLDPNAKLDDLEHPYLFLIPFIMLMLTGAGRFSADAKVFN